MDVKQFKQSVIEKKKPVSISPSLQSLWWEACGDWKKAHDVLQGLSDEEGAWIHAYLHRKEGELSNANYWYARAKKEMPEYSLREEWSHLVDKFL